MHLYFNAGCRSPGASPFAGRLRLCHLVAARPGEKTEEVSMTSRFAALVAVATAVLVSAVA
jgi:hypothetical protein